jgi:membrane-associated phospholipid phosphatase
LKKLINHNLPFLLPYLLFLVTAGFFLWMNDKATIHLYLNQHHSFFFDKTFPYLTHLGDLITALIGSVIIFFIHKKKAVFFFASNCLAGGITQLLKHFVYDDMVRPQKYFENTSPLNLIDGVEIYSYNTFPSGHATIAFSICFCLALLTNNKILKFALFAIALLIAYSRVYLSQHFLNDIYAGSLIGVLSSMLIYLPLTKTGVLKHE